METAGRSPGTRAKCPQLRRVRMEGDNVWRPQLCEARLKVCARSFQRGEPLLHRGARQQAVRYAVDKAFRAPLHLRKLVRQSDPFGRRASVAFGHQPAVLAQRLLDQGGLKQDAF
ncbi:hypothetical protein [Caulobacter sp. 17J80-11]|uniref:hypothetical protein n=1 Tax=Caulobacter sp. 17J80-11 TaxID=2763502 RepID=UPI001653BDA6|nr:hypothetical protein [Caulobacter sp. 17J80-11]MBC6983429.1 hypothetical protein [Caulobacter sp. 17J80-11]